MMEEKGVDEGTETSLTMAKGANNRNDTGNNKEPVILPLPDGSPKSMDAEEEVIPKNTTKTFCSKKKFCLSILVATVVVAAIAIGTGFGIRNSKNKNVSASNTASIGDDLEDEECDETKVSITRPSSSGTISVDAISDFPTYETASTQTFEETEEETTSSINRPVTPLPSPGLVGSALIPASTLLPTTRTTTGSTPTVSTEITGSPTKSPRRVLIRGQKKEPLVHKRMMKKLKTAASSKPLSRHLGDSGKLGGIIDSDSTSSTGKGGKSKCSSKTSKSDIPLSCSSPSSKSKSGKSDCEGSLECGKMSESDDDADNYICCVETYVPVGWSTDVCARELKEGAKCPSTRNINCEGSLECGRMSESDADADNYICCVETYVPFGWTTDVYVCNQGSKEGEQCPSTRDYDCGGSLECGKMSLSNDTYICCMDTLVPFGWTTDVCTQGAQGSKEAVKCPSTLDDDCEGSLECGQMSQIDDTYICCRDTYMPFDFSSAHVCTQELKKGAECISTRDDDCEGPLLCGKNYWDDSMYVCCENTFVPFGSTTELCVRDEGDWCGSTEDKECAGSLECGKMSEDDENYICCKDTYVPYRRTTAVCRGSRKGEKCPFALDSTCEGSLKCGMKSTDDDTYVCCDGTFSPPGLTTNVCIPVLSEGFFGKEEGELCSVLNFDFFGAFLDNCAGDLECARRSESPLIFDSDRICCMDPYTPPPILFILDIGLTCPQATPSPTISLSPVAASCTLDEAESLHTILSDTAESFTKCGENVMKLREKVESVKDEIESIRSIVDAIDNVNEALDTYEDIAQSLSLFTDKIPKIGKIIKQVRKTVDRIQKRIEKAITPIVEKLEDATSTLDNVTSALETFEEKTAQASEGIEKVSVPLDTAISCSQRNGCAFDSVINKLGVLVPIEPFEVVNGVLEICSDAFEELFDIDVSIDIPDLSFLDEMTQMFRDAIDWVKGLVDNVVSGVSELLCCEEALIPVGFIFEVVADTFNLATCWVDGLTNANFGEVMDALFQQLEDLLGGALKNFFDNFNNFMNGLQETEVESASLTLEFDFSFDEETCELSVDSSVDGVLDVTSDSETINFDSSVIFLALDFGEEAKGVADEIVESCTGAFDALAEIKSLDCCWENVAALGEECYNGSDRICNGELECGRKNHEDDTYVCCEDTFVPNLLKLYDQCAGTQDEGDKCPTTRDEECGGSLECGKKSESNADEDNYICCKDTYVPAGWFTDVCARELKKGAKCPSTRDINCEGNLECGRKNYWDQDTYVCCEDTIVPFGWTSDLCVQRNEGDWCGTTEDAECAGSLECGKTSKDDERYRCCKDTYVPFWWTTDVCH